MKNLMELPADLPVPLDDGACDHLFGAIAPDLTLSSTLDCIRNIRELSQKTAVLFFYPRTGDTINPTPKEWDAIAGARGCTPQSCSFRDHYREFQALGFEVFGVSSQDSTYQKEFVTRNHIPFEILSDEKFLLTEAWKLPTFEYRGLRLIKRLALVLEESTIVKVFYPVFPPNKNAESVLSWIRNRV